MLFYNSSTHPRQVPSEGYIQTQIFIYFFFTYRNLFIFKSVLLQPSVTFLQIHLFFFFLPVIFTQSCTWQQRNMNHSAVCIYRKHEHA